jgi:hypothetical protein
MQLLRALVEFRDCDPALGRTSRAQAPLQAPIA